MGLLDFYFVCILSQGGIKAVIWSDVFQAGCMIIGMIVILIQVFNAHFNRVN